MNIKEGNKLIAEFMGAVVTTPYPNNKEASYYHYDFGTCTHKSDYKSPDGLRFHTSLTVQYHTSWSWIMPVIEKVEKISDMTYESLNLDNNIQYLKQIYLSNTSIKGNNKLDVYYKAVLDFITWYNNEISK